MADKLATAVIEFVTDASRAFAGMDDLDKRGVQLSQSFGKVGLSLASAFAVPVTAAGVIGLIGKLGADALETADRLVKLQGSTGHSILELQGLERVSGQTSVALEELTGASYKLSLRVAQGSKDAKAATDELGLSFKALQDASPDERLNMVMKALAGVEDSAERARLGTALFGKGYEAIAPSVDAFIESMGDSATATDAQRKALDDQVKALDAAGDAWAAFKTKISEGSLLAFGAVARSAQGISQIFTAQRASLESLTAEQRKHYDSLHMLNGGQALYLIQIKQEQDAHAKAAKSQGQHTTATVDYTKALADARREIAAIKPEEKAAGDAAQKLGKSQEDVAAAYGISEGALKLYTGQLRESSAASKKLAADTAEVFDRTTGAFKKVAASGVAWGDGLSALQQLQVDYNIQLDETDHGAAAAADAMQLVADAIARTTGEVIHFGPPTNQMIAQLAKIQAAGTISASEGLLGAPIDTTLPPPPSRFSGWTSAVNDWAGQLPGQIARAFEGGGGWAGALSAGASTLGAGLMGKIFGSMGKDGKAVGGLANGMSGFFATAITAAGPIIGAVAGPLIGKILGHFKKPEFQRIANDVGKQWGVSISDGLAQQIEKDAKEKFGKDRVAGELFNLDAIIGEAGGLDTGNLDKFTGKLRDVFVMIGQGKFKAADAAKVLDANWSSFVAAHTDGNGRISKSLQEIIRLADDYGVKSKEIAAWQKGQGASAIEGFNAVVQAAAGTTRRELQNLETQALASYNAAVKAGTGEAEALAAIGPSLDAIREKWKALGLESDNAAFQALDAQREMLSANPALASGVDGLKQSMIALANLGALDRDTFAAMGETAALMYTRLQAEAEKLGKTGAEGTEAALRPMQQYLQLAAAQAKELGIPLDENTQELIRQSQELGIWRDAGLSASEKQTVALETLNSTMEKFASSISGIFDRAAGNPFAEWALPGGLAGAMGSGEFGQAPGGVFPEGPTGPSLGRTIAAATGFDGIVPGPTRFLAGERGAERVTITPLGRGGSGGDAGGGSSPGLNISVQVSGYVGHDIKQQVAKGVLEAINGGGDTYQAAVRLIQSVSPRLREAT